MKLMKIYLERKDEVDGGGKGEGERKRAGSEGGGGPMPKGAGCCLKMPGSAQICLKMPWSWPAVPVPYDARLHWGARRGLSVRRSGRPSGTFPGAV